MLLHAATAAIVAGKIRGSETVIRDSEPDHAGISTRIEGLFPSLSPQLRRAARYVLDRPDEVAFCSVRQLAAHAGVKPATMMRLAKVLDFPGFDAFREPFRDRLRSPPERRYAPRARELQARRDGQGALLTEMLALEHDNLRETFEEIGFDNLLACGQALEDARCIFVAGLRSCYPVAFYFHYACRLFRPSVELLDGRGGTFTDGLRGIGSQDALLAVSFAPYTRDTVNVVRYAAGRGACVSSITDSPVSPLAAVADHALIVANRSPSFFQSIVPAMAVAQALVAILVARGGGAALEALDESEAQLHDFEAYWEEEPRRSRPREGGA